MRNILKVVLAGAAGLAAALPLAAEPATTGAAASGQALAPPVERAIAARAAAQGGAQATVHWSERVTVRNPVGTRIAMRAGQVLVWNPAAGNEGSMRLGPHGSLPPSDDRQPVLSVDFTAVAGRHYVLVVEGGETGAEAQFHFQALTDQTGFGQSRVQRTGRIAIGISSAVTAAQAGPATVHFGWHGNEEDILAVEVHELTM